jgi:L-fuculose-phosphate aldolase
VSYLEQVSNQHLQTLREAVATAARQIAAEGLALGTSGNISARVGDQIAVTPTGADLSELFAEQITVVDRRGAVIDGTLAPTSELALHLRVYERYGAGAVVHTHSPSATALACVLEDVLPCIHYSMLTLGGDVPVAPYRTFGSEELATVTADALEGKTAALMANHGTITYADDVGRAVANARLLEWAAQLYVTASAVGTPRVMDPDQRQAVRDMIAHSQYGGIRQVSG